MPWSIAATTGISLLLYVTGVFVVFTPLPFVFGGLRRGALPAFASFVLSLTILAALYLTAPSFVLSFLPLAILQERLGPQLVAALSLVYFFYYGWLGFTLVWASRRSDSLVRSFLIILASGWVVPGILLLGIFKGFGFHPLAEVRGGLEFLMDRLLDLQQKSGLEGEEAAFLRGNASAIVSQMMGILPALAVNLSLVIVSLNILFIRRWSSERPFPGWVDFSLWRLGDKWIWAPIAGGILYFLNHYLIHWPLLGTMTVNLLLVLGAVYFFQGLAIISFFFRRRFSPLIRMLAYLVILLFVQAVGVVIVALGLFDFWFDFRKLKKIT